MYKQHPPEDDFEYDFSDDSTEDLEIWLAAQEERALKSSLGAAARHKAEACCEAIKRELAFRRQKRALSLDEELE